MTTAATLLAVVAAGCSASGDGNGNGNGNGNPGSGGSGGGTRVPVTITFDDLAGSTQVTTQYPGVTFSAPAPDVIRVFAYAQYCRTSVQMEACAGTANNCTKTFVMDFTGPVDNLRFRLGCTNSSAVIARAAVFQGTTMTTVDVNGTGVDTTPKDVDLSGYPGLTRVELAPVAGVDAEGYGVDDITFDMLQ
jgi:hypothetical protein